MSQPPPRNDIRCTQPASLRSVSAHMAPDSYPRSMHPLPETGQLPPGPMALQVEHLCMAFGAKVAVNDLSLAVPSGSLFGLVGPNGAGKTTTLSMAVGLLRPHYGRSLVYGYDVWNDPVAAKSLLGVLPDGLALPAQFTGHELLTYFGRLRGMPEDVIASRRDELLAALDLADAGGTVIADYSAGMTKKIGLASALLHGPRLLVLDEPFEAVDPISSAGIRSILLSFVHSGGSVILSSHVMALVEQLCTHIGVIADGRVVASGTVDEVRAGNTLDEAFVRLVGSRSPSPDGLSWMR
eukprot:gene23927-28703_t